MVSPRGLDDEDEVFTYCGQSYVVGTFSYDNAVSLTFRGCPEGQQPPPTIGLMWPTRHLKFLSMKKVVLPAEIGSLARLSTLSFQDVEEIVLPGSVGRLHHLASLEVKNAKTLSMPNSVGSLTRLKSLLFEDIETTSLPTEIGWMYRLTKLQLIKVRGASLPSILSFTNLKVLEVFESDLKEVPSSLYKLGQLTKLRLHNNKLSHLAEKGLQSNQVLWNLEYLELQDNNLEEISLDFVKRTPDLKTANFKRNNINSLPRWPSGYPDWGRLQELDISENDVVTIPTEVATLFNLKTMNFQQNAVTALPSEVGRLQLLSVLDVQGNSIAEIPAEVGSAYRLRELYLADNTFETVPSTIAKLTRLTELKIGPLLCDCELLGWFTELFERVAAIRDPYSAAQCSEANEYGQNFPHLLKSDANAPCSSPKLVEDKTEIEPTQTTLFWTLEAKTSQDAIIFGNGSPPLGESDDAFFGCEAGEPRIVSGGSGLKYLGFAVDLQGINTALYKRNCYSASELSTTEAGESMFKLQVPDLPSSTTFEVTIRPFALGIENDGTLTYRYGIATMPFRFATEDFPPSRSTNNMYLESAGARELTVSWDPIEGSGDLVVEYQLQLSEVGSGIAFSQTAISRTATLRGAKELKVATEYEVVVRGRTSSPVFGPWSRPFKFTTCPLNMAYDMKRSSECYALIGYFKYQEKAVSCTTIPGDFLKEGGCDVTGIDVTDIPMAPGAWRASLESLDIQQCPEVNFCEHASNLTGANQYCAENHKGIFCSECEDGYALATTGCVPCNTENLVEGETAVGLGVMMFVIIVLLLFARILGVAGACSCKYNKKKKDELTDDPHDSLDDEAEAEAEFVEENPFQMPTLMFTEIERHQRPKISSKESIVETPSKKKLRNALQSSYFSTSSLVGTSIQGLFGTKEYSDKPGLTTFAVKLQILFAFNQVIFAYGRILTSRSVPTSLAAVIGFITYVDFGAFFAEFKFRCIYNFGHYDDLALRTVSPLLLLSILYILKAAAAWVFPSRSVLLQRGYVSIFLFILFLIYPSVSQVILETFWCEEFDAKIVNTSQALVALKTDYRLLCHDREPWVLYTICMTVIYPVGIVLVYCYYLYTFKDIMQKMEKSREEKELLVKVSFLVEPYKTETFWFEAYELIRKLMQTSLIGFFQETPKTMTFFASCICVLAIGVIVFFQPYKRDIDNVFAFVSLLILTGGIQYSNDVKYLHGGRFLEPMTSIVYVELSAFIIFVFIDAFIYILKSREDIYFERPLLRP